MRCTGKEESIEKKKFLNFISHVLYLQYFFFFFVDYISKCHLFAEQNTLNTKQQQKMRHENMKDKRATNFIKYS